ncbi:MAG: formylglycine-generating enzyme family protein [Gammaproteobacteria bacterium]|nr:formylglycine-generating enzyme family protein [Gammaproteobacteria bacterium]
MAIIPAGRFTMGGRDGSANERPQRQVKLGAFYLGKTEVTQAQWVAVMGSNPSLYKHPKRPVDQVTWIQVQEFIQRLNEHEETTKYRLPTEAEWEYAARSGTTTSYSFPKNELAKFAWYGHSGNVGTRPVGQRQRNAWGLADMHGNVWEWVEDCWHDNYTDAPSDGRAWTEQADCASRVLRGGAWNSESQYVRSATRGSYVADMNDAGNGFRLARSL